MHNNYDYAILADETPSTDIISTSNDYATNINTISIGKIYNMYIILYSYNNLYS